jgi:hypothetical protein
LTTGPFGAILYTSNSKERNMMSHAVAFIAGIIVATVGFTGVAQIADSGVQKVQTITREATK